MARSCAAGGDTAAFLTCRLSTAEKKASSRLIQGLAACVGEEGECRRGELRSLRRSSAGRGGIPPPPPGMTRTGHCRGLQPTEHQPRSSRYLQAERAKGASMSKIVKDRCARLPLAAGRANANHRARMARVGRRSLRAVQPGHPPPRAGSPGTSGSDLDEQRPRPRFGGDIRDGGPRPEIAPKTPPTVAFAHDFPANSIVINTGARKLYYVLGNGQAYEYAVSVGREGFNWAGTETISRKQAWPDWHPPAEMRDRDPSLPEKMTGGTQESAGRDGPVSGHHALSHSRNQRCEIDRTRRVVGLLPHAQCRRVAPRLARRRSAPASASCRPCRRRSRSAGRRSAQANRWCCPASK